MTEGVNTFLLIGKAFESNLIHISQCVGGFIPDGVRVTLKVLITISPLRGSLPVEAFKRLPNEQVFVELERHMANV